ncbi:MAG: tetratricopeptide repeat protein [Prosthecobacter sp.]
MTPEPPFTRDDVIASLRHADALRTDARYAESEAVFRELLPVCREVCGPASSLTRTVLNNWAVLYKYMGRFDEGTRLYHEALALEIEHDGGETDAAATLYHNLGGIAHAQRRYAEAEAPARKSVEIRTKLHGPDHLHVAADEAALASILVGLEKFEEAGELYLRSHAVFLREHGPEHYEIAVSFNNQAALHQATGRLDESRRCYEQSLALKEKLQGPDHVDVAITLNNLASVHVQQGRPQAAAPLYERALRIFETRLPPEHPSIEICRENLADCRA